MRKLVLLFAINIILPFLHINFSVAQNFITGKQFDLNWNETDEIAPAKVKDPVIPDNNETITFEWNPGDIPNGFTVLYELLIFETDGKSVIFKQNIPKNQFILNRPHEYLIQGEEYFFQVNSQISNFSESFKVLGEKSKFVFGKIIPECTVPRNIRVLNSGRDFVELTWDGAEASIDGVQYEIRIYRGENKNIQASNIVTNGLKGKFESLQFGVEYTIEIRKVCNHREAETSKWVTINYSHQRRQVSLPAFVCGEPFNLPNLDTLHEMCIDHGLYGWPDDSILYIGGFPIYYDSIDTIGCSVVYEPILDVFDIPVDTVIDTIYCEKPDTSCYTVAIGDSIVYLGDSICCYRFDEWGNRVYGSCEPLGPWDEVHIDTCAIYDTVQIFERYCDTLGWYTDICDTTVSVNWVTITDTIGWDSFICDCSYSGTGVVPLPFGEEQVRVRFEGVRVKVELLPFGMRKHHIYNKKVYGLFDDPENYPDYKNAPPIELDEFCDNPYWDENGNHIETGQPWDPDGFSQNGLYIKEPPYPGYVPGNLIDTSGTYDPNGFDADGNHVSGGTTNEYGCTQDQLNASPAIPPCDSLPPPYYWLDTTGTSPPTQPGLVFEQEIRDTLPILVDTALAQLLIKFQDTLASLTPLCDSIREEMRSKVDTLGYDSTLIFGPNGEYIQTGMYENFKSRPEGIAENRYQPRNTTTIALENDHTALYDCDKGIALFVQLVSTTTDHQTQSKMDEIVSTLSEKIKRMSQEEVDRFSDLNKFFEWILKETEIIIREANTAIYGDLSNISFGEEHIGFAINDSKEPLKVFSGGSSANALLNSGINLAELDSILAEAKMTMNEKWSTAEDFEWTPSNFAKGYAMVNGTPDPELLPIEVERMVFNKTYVIYLDSIYFDPLEGGYLDAYITIQHKNNQFVFSGKRINFKPTGLPMGNGRLNLSNDIELPLSKPALLRINGASGNTYVSWSCHGFDGMSIDAEIEFCRRYIVPYDKDNKIPMGETDNVTASFIAQMPAWGEFYAQISFNHSFAVTKAENVVWTVDSAYLDFSSRISPTNIQVPNGYFSPHMNGQFLTDSWRGFYLKELSATVTPKFTGEGTDPRTIGVQNMLIDDRGFSGELFIEPVISLSEGNMNGWAFSIDRLDLTIIHNQFRGGGFEGLVNVPIFSSNENPTGNILPEDCFSYKAIFQPDNKYLFSVKMPQTGLKIPMWKAGYANIDSSSSVLLTYEEETGFDALANLTGEIKISTKLFGNDSLKIPRIRFQNVQLSNKPDYFNVGAVGATWEFPDTIGTKFTGFEISVMGIHMVSDNEGNPGIGFDVSLKLGERKENLHLDILGGFKLLGELEMIGNQQRWKYKKLKVDDFSLDGRFPGVPSITGFLVHYGDSPTDPPEYGTGFRGGVSLQLEALKGASFTAVGQFGKINGYKYFFVDILACVDIPLGTLNLKGVGGGVTFRMVKDTIINTGLLCDGAPPPIDPKAIGHSLTGAVYVPDSSYSIGLKLTVALAAQQETAFSGNATLEVLFNAKDSLGQGGGLATIDLYGNCVFMADFDMGASPDYDDDETNPPSNRTASIKGFFSLSVNFNERFFDGNFIAHIDSPNGFIKGYGDVSVRISKDEWYFKAGTPIRPIWVAVSVPRFTTNGVLFAMYLQFGSNIDPMPALPAEVYEITGATNVSDENRQNQLNQLAGNREWNVTQGAGFAFGLKVELGGNEELNFLIFYAQLGLEFGFDLGIRKNNSTLVCSQTNELPGINGWYAEGQAWALINAKLGIRVRVFKKERRFSIADLTGAVALQAKLPNPLWMEGAVGVKYDVLGGLVKGQASFKFQIGELCDYNITTEELSLIQSIYPEDGTANKFPVDNDLSVTFTYPMNKPFEIQDGNSTLELEPVIESVKLFYGDVSNDMIICTEGSLSNDGRVYTLVPCAMLPGNDTLQLQIRYRIDSAGIAGAVRDSVVSFVTGAALDYIPPTNVSGSYPINGQYNFYKNEIQGGVGYLQLNKGQPELLADYESSVYVRFEDPAQNEKEVKCVYKAIDEKLEFPIPSEYFSSNQLYKMELVVRPEDPFAYSIGTQSNNVPFSSDDKVIYTLYFRASQYATFAEKVQAMVDNGLVNDKPVFHAQNNPNPKEQGVNFTLPEPFDKLEIQGMVKMSKEKDLLIANKGVNTRGEKLFTLPNEDAYLGMYYKYPIDVTTCETGANPPRFYVNFNRENPADKIEIKCEDFDIEQYVVTKDIFESGSLPNYTGTQRMYVYTYKLYNSHYYALKSNVEQARDRCKSEYRNFLLLQNPNQTPTAEELHIYATNCMESNGVNFSFFEEQPGLPTGENGYDIYLKYNLPSYGFEPYSIIRIAVPSR